MYKVILIEDDSGFGYILSEYLRLHEFDVTWSKNAKDGLKSISKNKYDVGIFDIMLPDQSGFEIAKEVREKGLDMPFIFLSAKTLKIDKLKGYNLGAEDYVTKPVDEELLLAKLKVILSRKSLKNTGEEEILRGIGKYKFDPNIQTLQIESTIIQLTKTESELLLLLENHRNHLLSRTKALNQIWRSNDEFSRKSMDVFISKLRKHLSKDPSISINNIHGKGFILLVE